MNSSKPGRGISRAVCGVVFLIALATGCENERQAVVFSGAEIGFELGGTTVQAEVVFEQSSRELGLMFRKPEELPKNSGMLFVYPYAERLGFWMKNTEIPLSIAYIGDQGEILQIEHMKPKDLRSVRSRNKVRYALEMHQGWFQGAGVGVGTKIPDFEKKVDPFRARAERSPSARR